MYTLKDFKEEFNTRDLTDKDLIGPKPIDCVYPRLNTSTNEVEFLPRTVIPGALKDDDSFMVICREFDKPFNTVANGEYLKDKYKVITKA